MENNIKTKKSWKKILKKYIDFDDSGEVDWWEIGIVIIIIFLFQLGIEIVANLITK